MADSVAKAFQSRLWSLFTRNVGLKITSLVVATSVWAFVQSSQEVEVRTRAKVRWTLPDGLVSVEPLRKSLIVTVSGPQGRARTLERGDLQLEVEIDDAERGPLTLDFTEIEMLGVPPGLSVVQLSPPAADLVLEPPLTREVRVKPLVMGEPAEGYRRVKVSAEPQTVEIKGPESLVRDISEIPTDIIDISAATESRTTAVPLAIKERTVAPVGERSVQVRVEVEEIQAERTFQEVPVLVRAPGWICLQETVEVKFGGPVNEMSKLQADQVSLILDLPPDTPEDAEEVEVEYSPGDDGGAVQITYMGSKAVEVLSLSPARFLLTRDKK